MNDAESARSDIVHALRMYMVGPIQDPAGEVLHAGERDKNGRPRVRQYPSDLYHTGILHPSQSVLDPEEAEHEENDTAEGAGIGDGILSLANAIQQSAMGLTFRCDLKCKSVSVVVEWAEYIPVARPAKEADWRPYEKTSEGLAELGWKRVPYKQHLEVNLSELQGQTSGKVIFKDNGVVIHAKPRKSGGLLSITLALVNERETTKGSFEFSDQRLYQSSIAVQLTGDDHFKKVSSPPGDDDFEAWNYELLFFREQEFSVGHGISTSWHLDEDNLCREVSTEWIPVSEVYKASADIESLGDGSIFELKNLGDESRKSETLAGLRKIAVAYKDWIDDSRASLVDRWSGEEAKVLERLSAAADRNLQACEAQLQRLFDAVSDLDSDRSPHMWDSFCLANQAMRISMLRGMGGDREPRWRPFQLAFILIALRSTLEANHEDRSVLDLIWFPTGGGKTEAYLGLTCAAIFHRRLLNPKLVAFGTTVITRYTLRLLTLQQFERTARVIFACEVLRREQEHVLGKEPISIGLYAGRDATPNRMKDAELLIAQGASYHWMFALGAVLTLIRLS